MFMPHKFHRHVCTHCLRPWRCYVGEGKNGDLEQAKGCSEILRSICNKCFKKALKELEKEDQILIRENPHAVLAKKPYDLYG